MAHGAYNLNEWGEYVNRPISKTYHIKEEKNDTYSAVVREETIYGVGKTELSASLNADASGAPEDAFFICIGHDIYEKCNNIPKGGVIIENVVEVEGVYRLKTAPNTLAQPENTCNPRVLTIEEFTEMEIEEDRR